MDEVVLREMAERLQYLRNLDQRKAEVLASIAEQDKLTAELEKKIQAAERLQEVEDRICRTGRNGELEPV